MHFARIRCSIWDPAARNSERGRSKIEKKPGGLEMGGTLRFGQRKMFTGTVCERAYVFIGPHAQDRRIFFFSSLNDPVYRPIRADGVHTILIHQAFLLTNFDQCLPYSDKANL